MAQVFICPGPTKSFLGFCPQGIALLKNGKSGPSGSEREGMYKFKITDPLLELVCSISREFARFAPNYVTPPEKAVFPIFGLKNSSAQAHNIHPGAIWVH